jgi:hypothetical protein
MAEYINTNQDDLSIRYEYSEDLSGYSAIVYVYALADGLTAAVGYTGALTAGTATSYVTGSLTADSVILDEASTYVTFCEITKSSRSRATRPYHFRVQTRGVGTA